MENNYWGELDYGLNIEKGVKKGDILWFDKSIAAITYTFNQKAKIRLNSDLIIKNSYLSPHTLAIYTSFSLYKHFTRQYRQFSW